MTKETSYNRYKRVLEEIADGADNPVERAIDALRDRKIVATSTREHDREVKRKAAEKERAERLRCAKEYYLSWMANERPPIAAFARNFGMSRGSMGTLLKCADKELPEAERRLYWSYRTLDFKTVAQVKAIYAARDMVWEKLKFEHLSNPHWRMAHNVIDEAVDVTRDGGALSLEVWSSAAVRYLKKHNAKLLEEIWAAMKSNDKSLPRSRS